MTKRKGHEGMTEYKSEKASVYKSKGHKKKTAGSGKTVAYKGRGAGHGRRPSGRQRQRRNQLQKKRERLVYDLISSKNYRPMREREIAALLEVPKELRKELFQTLSVLEEEHKIERTRSGKYQKVRRKATETLSLKAKAREGLLRNRRDTGRSEQMLPPPKGTSVWELITETVRSYGIPVEFSPRQQRQAQISFKEVSEKDKEGRMDLTDQLTITIDGEDAKDMDDAVSLTRVGDAWVLGVHIADVSNYVQANSALDREAIRRGTSVYLCDRTIPMLPRELSNGICSLMEGEVRLTLSCLMTIDTAGDIVKSEIRESVIRSRHKMTYTEVNRILTEEDSDLMEKYADVVPMLFEMQKLSILLRTKREKRGAIEFDLPETKFRLDEDGTPLEIYPNEINAATRLIEDFMIVANEVVAKTYADLELPFLYRTHESPDEEKIETTLGTVRRYGFSAQKRQRVIRPREVQAILKAVQGSSMEDLLSGLLLRSMKQARYTTENIGHFGLAAKYYCHFTSPIRRYPDLQIHRIIKDHLRGRLNDRRIKEYRKALEDVAWKSSALERRSVEVERETNKMKMAEYAALHLGEAYTGVISGVTGWGIYIQLPNTLEGLIHVLSLQDDYYLYDEENKLLRGRETGKEYHLGQKLKVRIKAADPALHSIDFEQIEDMES